MSRELCGVKQLFQQFNNAYRRIIHLDAVGSLVRSLKYIMGPKKSLMKLANISKDFVVCFVTDIFCECNQINFFHCLSLLVLTDNMLIVCSTWGEL